MDKPAPKDPFTEEILSSIRQIIAEDDSAARRPLTAVPTPPRSYTPADPDEIAVEFAAEPSELSSDRARPASVARAAPLPDPQLTADLADQLLEPATEAVIGRAFDQLANLPNAGSGLAIEDTIRDMLRPMLKEWLDENLPAVVERMVEQEIARVSRGGR